MSADFRACDPGSITWRRGGRKGGVLAAGEHGTRVVVQTPRFNCRVSVHSPGILRVDMKVPPVGIGGQLAQWISDVEASATGSWKDGLSLSTSVYGTNFRVMLFSDTLVFDENGQLSADAMQAGSGALLLELTGAWTSPGRWGLRWKVVQFKFWKAAVAEPPPMDDDDVPTAECMFVD